MGCREEKEHRHSFTGHSAGVSSVAFSPDGRSCLHRQVYDSSVKLWDVVGAEKNCEFRGHTFSGHSRPVSSVAFSPDGVILASGSTDNSQPSYGISFLDENLLPLNMTEQAMWNLLRFHLDGRLLASANVDSTVRLKWDIDRDCLTKSLLIKGGLRFRNGVQLQQGRYFSSDIIGMPPILLAEYKTVELIPA